MAGRVSVARDGADTGEDLPGREQARAVLVGRGLLARALEIELLGALAGHGHLGVVEPVAWLVFVHDQLGVGKVLLPSLPIGQSGRVIGMPMAGQYRLACGPAKTRGP